MDFRRARIFGDMYGPAADDRAAARAGTEFRQGHPNRHRQSLYYAIAPGERRSDS